MIKDSIFLPLKDEYRPDYTLLSNDDMEKGLYVRQLDHFDNCELDKEISISNFKKIDSQFRADQYERIPSYVKVQVLKLARITCLRSNSTY